MQHSELLQIQPVKTSPIKNNNVQTRPPPRAGLLICAGVSLRRDVASSQRFLAFRHTQTDVSVPETRAFEKRLPEIFRELCFAICTYTGNQGFLACLP